MDNFIGCCWFLLALITLTSGNETSNDTTAELREPRVSGRIVKVYSGHRPEPFLCTKEGFQPDLTNCAVFYRCVKERSGKLTVFRYQCSPGTVYDPDVETCNHPKSTKRSECGGIAKPDTPEHENNEIYESQKEIPRPISTRYPIYTEKAPESTTTVPHWVFSNHNQTNPTTVASVDKYNTQQFSGYTTPYPTGSTPNSFYGNYLTNKPSTFRTTTQHSSGKTEICTSDGFTGDYENCRKFYRCVGNQRGGFMRYEFYCSESTVWDDELQSCNHPWAIKRSKCGRSMSYSEHVTTSTEQAGTEKSTTVKEGNKNTFGDKTVQQQLQISHGAQVTQSQTQISHSDQVVQNQTQIHYGDVAKNKYLGSKQNQTQISYGSAISQSQTQIDYGNKGMQTQLQIDHSKNSSQSQTQIHESTTQETTTTQQNIQHDSGNNKCSKNGFMGDKNNCKKFYRCVDNGRGTFTKYEYMCGDGTVWDSKIESCNHAWAVKECEGHESSESHKEDHTTTTVKPIYHTEATKTTQNYHTTQDIDDSEDIDVGYGNQGESEATSTTSSTTTTTKSSTTKKPNEADNECSSSGFMGDPNDCKIFYRCVDNGRGYTKHEFKCGDGTLWDPDIEACNHASAVKKCGGSSSINKEESTTKQTTTTTAGVQTTVTLVQTTTEASNPDEDYDSGYQPSDKPSHTTTTTSNTPDHSNKDNQCTDTGFMGDRNDCKKFYRCVDNGNGGFTRHEFTCGEGTVWDPKIEACNHAWAVQKCGGSNQADHSSSLQPGPTTENDHSTTIPTTSPENHQTTHPPIHSTTSSLSTTTVTSASSTGNECQQSGFMGDKNDCKKFYRCVDNGDSTYTRYEFTCGEGTVWDGKIEACNHAWAVENCGGNKVTPSNLPSTSSQYPIMDDEQSENEITTHGSETSHATQSSTIIGTSTISNEISECNGNGFYGDKNDCKKFYRCVDDGNGGYIRYEFNCGDGTVWDDEISACNHASAVKECGTAGSTTKNPHHSSTEPAISTSEVENTDSSESSTHKTSTTGSQNNEISDGECTQDGFLGSQTNCNKFYRCVDDGKGGYTKYEFTCGDGTSWNQNIQACDHESDDRPCGSMSQSTTKEPQHVHDEMESESSTSKQESSTQTSEQTNTQATQSPSSSDKCESEGFYGDSKDCKKFYRCVDNGQGGYTKYDFVCGQGTSWNQEIKACDHESDDKTCLSSSSSSSTVSSQSESSTMSSSSTTDQQSTEEHQTSEASSSNDQCTSEGFFPHQNDCHKFVRCVSNGDGKYTRYEFTCGEGTVWVQEIQACDHDNEQNKCKSSPTEKPESTQESSTSISSTAADNSQIVNKEDDEYPENSSHSESEECTSEGYYGDKNDCRKFYRCVDNGDGSYTKYDFVCGDGTAWDSDVQTCNHISEVKSCSDNNKEESQTQQTPKDEETHTTESSSSSSSSGTTAATGTTSSDSSGSSSSGNDDKCEEEGYFGDSKDCKKFYRCVDDGKGGYTKYDFTCADGTIWDQDITNCNHPQDVANPSCKNEDGNSDSSSTTSSSSSSNSSSSTTSSSESSSGTTESSSQSSSNCSQENSSKKPEDNKNITCEKAGYYANPDDCKKFYRCVDWDGDGKKFSVYHFECGEGTIWDPALDTCNHEESVYPPRDCSRSQSQSETSTEQSTTTTEESTTEQSTTQEPTTSDQTTTEQSTTSSEKTTTQESTTSEQTTTQESTTSEQTTTQQTTTSEQTTTQQSTTSEQTTTEQTTTTTTQESTTSEQTTTQESTTSEQTTTEQTTEESSTTEQSNEQTTESSTTEQSNEQTTESTTEQTTESTTEQSNEQTTESTTEQTTESTTEQSNEQTTESTTEQTTESTTEQSNEQTTESTTEQTTESTTEQSNDQTTESSTTEQTDSTTEESNESTTEESTTTTESETESTTEQSSSEKECPETDDDQYVLVCPTSFRRHPKYCNMFYQCTEDEDNHDANVATFKCPNNTIYDESQTQCVEEKNAEKKCDGEMARRLRFKRLSSREPITADTEKKSCPNVGYYPFEKRSECSPAFIKCEKTKSGKLRGFVNQCPNGYIFWNISKRCELAENVKDCKRSSNDWKGRWNIPVERKNVAI